MLGRWLRWWRCAGLRRAGARVGKGVQSFEPFFEGYAPGLDCAEGAYFCEGSRIIIGGDAKKCGQLKLGFRVFLNKYAIIDCHEAITLGEGVMIGPHAYICDFDHDTSLTQGLAFGASVGRPVDIQRFAWIGANAVILKGVTIGEGAVVGAGSVVTRDVAPLAIVAGNPARVLRMRQRRSG